MLYSNNIPAIQFNKMEIMFRPLIYDQEINIMFSRHSNNEQKPFIFFFTFGDIKFTSFPNIKLKRNK